MSKDGQASGPLGGPERLRITLLALNYAPEPTGIAPYATGLAEGLAEHHDVSVVTGQPHYPAWNVSEGYGRATRSEVGGVDVRRVAHYVPQNPSNLQRLRLEASYGLRSTLRSWQQPDVVLCASPAMFSSSIAAMRTRFGVRRPALGVWVQDLYGLGASETGSVGGRAARGLAAAERRLLRRADGVAVIHDCFRRIVTQDVGVDADKVVVMRNWSHVDFSAAPDRAAARARFGWSDDDVIVLHAGNMGVKQGLVGVVDAARAAHERGSRVRFVLVGDGRERAAVEAAAQDVPSVELLPTLDDADFAAALHGADALLVNELPGVSEMAVPSKLTSYFATGRPVIGAVSPLGGAASEILAAGAGVLVDAAVPASLVDAAEQLAADPARSDALGRRGREYCRAVLTRASQISRWDAWVRQLAAGTSPAPVRSTAEAALAR